MIYKRIQSITKGDSLAGDVVKLITDYYLFGIKVAMTADYITADLRSGRFRGCRT